MQTPIVIQIEEEEWQKLKARSKKEGVSEERVVLEAVSEYLKTKD